MGCYPEIESYAHGVRVLKEIAETTQGKFFPLNEAELLVKIITGVAIEEIDKIAIQKSILEEMGVSMEEFPANEELTEDRIKELTAKVRSSGMTKRAMKHEAARGMPRAPALYNLPLHRHAVRRLTLRAAYAMTNHF